MCLQETKLDANLDHKLLSFPVFSYDAENCTIKSRIGIFINTYIKYVRRNDLEANDSHSIVVVVPSTPNLRIINIYRTHNPPDNQRRGEFFHNQLIMAIRAKTINTILMGDFNLD
jgi:exonuclease III